MRLGTKFKVGRLTSVCVSRYPTKNSAWTVAGFLFLGFFFCAEIGSDVKMSLVPSGIWRRVMLYKLPVCTICHGPDCLAFEEADERLTVVEQVIP